MELIIKGKSYIEEGKFPEAIETLSVVINQQGSKVEAYFWRATAYLKIKAYENALNDLNETIGLYDEFAEAYSLRGVVLFHLKRGQEALGDMNKALELDSENPYRYSSRAYIRASIGDVEGGIEDYQKTIELDPEDAIAYNNLGLLHESLGYKKMAQTHFKKSDKILGVKKTSWDSVVLDKEKPAPLKKENIPSKVSVWATFIAVFSSKEEFKKYLGFLKSFWFSK
jgi:tetratricopeptide (TPR) repeat protein